MMITKKIGVVDGIGYIIFQIIGAIVATGTLVLLFPEIGKDVFWGAHGGPSALLGGSMMSALLVEIILTFFLVTVIFMTVVHKKAPKSVYGAVIGGMIFLLHLVGVPLTGASMNPARSLSPTLFSGDTGLWEVQWLYWVGPIVGGVIAALIMHYVYTKPAEKEA
jgi:glycerol uptake facilitator-like aquaporin